MKTHNDHLQSIFVQHPNKWLSMNECGMTHKENNRVTRKIISSYRLMPKASLAVLGIMCVLAGCSVDPKPGTYTRDGVQFQTICGCEYIVSDIHGESYGTIYTHKGNCTNIVHKGKALEVEKCSIHSAQSPPSCSSAPNLSGRQSDTIDSFCPAVM